MADQIYSLTLAFAMFALALAFVFRLAAGRRLRPMAMTFSSRAAAFSLALVAISTFVHLGFGHPPGSPTALGPIEFIGEHPANVTVAGLGLVLLWLGRGYRSRQRSSSS